MNAPHSPTPETRDGERYRFAGFELRVDQGELHRGSETVQLQRQPFKVLTLLVRRAGQLVTREELRDEIWGRETHVDFDRGLNFCIKQVRRALGDDAAEPRFIRTLPRRGYRFIAEVEPSAPSTSAPAGGSMRRASTVAAAAAGVVLLTLGVTWWFGSAASRETPVDPLAMDLFLRGQHLLQQGTPEGLEQGRQLLLRATETAPELAQAHLALARSFLGDAAHNAAEEAAEDATTKARAAVDRALEADPFLAEAWALRGGMRLHLEWDWEGAGKAYARAVELDPDDPTLRHAYANYLSLAGDHEQAVVQIEQAMQLDPVSTALKADGGWFLYRARRFEEAESLCRTTVELDPSNRNGWWCLLQLCERTGRAEEALGAARQLASLMAPEEPTELAEASEFWNWYVARLDSGKEPSSPTIRGLGHLGAGDRDAAMRWFERAVEAGSSCALQLAVEPRVDGLRADPRFVRLLERIPSAGASTRSRPG